MSKKKIQKNYRYIDNLLKTPENAVFRLLYVSAFLRKRNFPVIDS